jgi:hypothetical protein
VTGEMKVDRSGATAVKTATVVLLEKPGSYGIRH